MAELQIPTVVYFWPALHSEIFVIPIKHDGTKTNLVIENDVSCVPQAIYTEPSSGSVVFSKVKLHFWTWIRFIFRTG